MRGNNGFTLAEVLITLVIIGVIGALTVPSLIQNTQKQEYVSALKKAYSTLSQAAQMIITEEGSPKGNGSWLAGNEEFYSMFKKYLNNAKECGTGSGCFQNTNYKRLDGSTSANWHISSANNRLVSADGTMLNFMAASNSCNGNNLDFNGSNNVCGIIRTDINGQKGPNKTGRDLFDFVLKENGVYPAGCDTDECPGNLGWGFGCACKVLREGAMNY